MYKRASQALKQPEGSFKLVHKGSAITNSSAAAAAKGAKRTAPLPGSSTAAAAGSAPSKKQRVVPDFHIPGQQAAVQKTGRNRAAPTKIDV